MSLLTRDKPATIEERRASLTEEEARLEARLSADEREAPLSADQRHWLEERRAWRGFRDTQLGRLRARYERLASTTAPGHERAAGLPYLERAIRELEAHGDIPPEWFNWGLGEFTEGSVQSTGRMRRRDMPSKTRRLQPGEPWPRGYGMAPGATIGPRDVVDVPAGDV
jgi:hypothetical protein